jgi:nucleolar protein 4
MHRHADALRVLRWANNNPAVHALFDTWWKEELADLYKQETAKDSPDDAKLKRMKDELDSKSVKLGKGTLIVEFSIENVQVVQRRSAAQKVQVGFPHTSEQLFFSQ